MDVDKIFSEFCDALPDDLHLTMEQKKQAFDLLFRLCYAFIFHEKAPE